MKSISIRKNSGIFTLIIYACTLLIVMHYHEPGFDEAQAWLIARDSSIIELLTVICHYEGHPPFWHLILMPLAKSGVPFEIGLKLPGFVFSTISAAITIFKAPFPLIIRCLIPFTYFPFYQYGVISRPYSLLAVGFMLAAWLYKDRNNHPFAFGAALSVMSASSLYGMVFSAGIAVFWVWELFSNRITWYEIRRSKQIHSLSILLILNLAILATIYPYPDTFAISIGNGEKSVMLLYLLFGAPADATCCDYYSQVHVSKSLFQTLIYVLIGCLVNITIFVSAKTHGKLGLYVIPATLFVIVGGLIWFMPHHLGVLVLFYIFFFWCCMDEEGECGPRTIQPQWHWPKSVSFIYRYISPILLVTTLGISLYWSFTACSNDVKLNYGEGRIAAAYIKEKHLDQNPILAGLIPCFEDGISTLAYFDKNLYINLNNHDENKSYVLHKVDRRLFETDLLLPPDTIFVSSNNFNRTLQDYVGAHDYVLLKTIESNTIWKDKTSTTKYYFYARRDSF